ncbi:MAG TPA: hypothetical protein VE955_01050 [Candidatus Dormibacteraeota bacterium]|jgi:hypothetical protein|nr:hypothetical protein [Candidatus Dormibacteraeota bacterium]
MKIRFAKLVIAAAITILLVGALGPTAHAQPTTSALTDRASYVPGDSGTLTLTLVNNDASNTLEIRNITIYWPWAQYVNGQWPSGANVSQNLSPWPVLGSSTSGNNIKTYTFSFTVPSWFSGTIFGSGSNCPGRNGPRYSTSYHACILVGYTASPPVFSNSGFSIAMALPTYTPTSIVSQWLPIATLVVLVAATVLLAMVWMSTRRMNKK